jgi:diacylglycerol kinase (ATP)
LSNREFKPFQEIPNVSWSIGLPASSAEADIILIFGGDGTIHRHLEQLVQLQLPVLIVPCGSGNDFARALNLPRRRDSLSAWRKFARGDGNVRMVDLGLITSAKESRYFCCIGGVGLDGEVARRANELPRWLRGHGGYPLSLLPALFRFAPWLMKISMLQGNQLVERSAKPTVLAVFANGPSYGGGMRIAPGARLDDGLLDICVVSDIDKFKLFCLFPTVYFGRHLKMEEVDYFQAEGLRVETETPLDVYADGEYVCQTPIDVGVARAALRVVV